MTPQELKNSILQLAIQGKLVEQRPEEGTAEELYRQIQREKQALIKAGKIKKEKPLPEIAEDEIPFDIPESWKWVRLAELCTIVTGKKDANYGSPDGKYFFFTCAKEPIRCKSFSFSGESLLLAGNGDIGNISYYWGQFEAYQRTYVLQPYIENGYLKYLYYHLQSNWIQYNLGMVFGTAIPYIRLGNVQNYPIALPPLAEQKRIVAKIEELLPLMDRYEKAWNRLEDFNRRFPADMQKSLLQLAIQGKLVEQRHEEGTGEELYRQIQKEKQALIKAGKIKKEKPLPEITENEIPFDIPESWKWVRLSEICNVSDGTHQTPKYVDHGIPFISAQNVKPYRFIPEVHRDVSYADYLEYNKNISPEKGDILMTRVGAGIGEAAIIDQDFQFSIYVSLTLIKRYSLQVDMEYLLNVLNSPLGDNLSKKKTLGKGSSQGNLNLIFIREFVLPLPPLAEQKRIVAKLEELLPLCEKMRRD